VVDVTAVLVVSGGAVVEVEVGGGVPSCTVGLGAGDPVHPQSKASSIASHLSRMRPGIPGWDHPETLRRPGSGFDSASPGKY
jgi:hypothetical protein